MAYSIQFLEKDNLENMNKPAQISPYQRPPVPRGLQPRTRPF